MTRTAMLLIMVFLFVSQSFAQVHGNRAHYAEYGPQGKYLAIAGDDLLLLDRSNNEVRVVNAHNPEARNVAFSQDGRYLAAESNNFSIYVYDLKDPSKQAVFFKGLKKRIGAQTKLRFSPDGTILATGNSSKINFYSLAEGSLGKVVYTINNDPSNTSRSFASFDITPDWKTVLFNMQSIKLEKKGSSYKHTYGKKLDWSGAVVTNAIISADGSKAAVTARNGQDHRIYDTKTGDPIAKNSSPKTVGLAANKDFTKIYMNQAVWDLRSQKIQNFYQARSVEKNNKPQITVAPDNEDFMIGLYQYNSDGKLKKVLQQKLTTFNRVSFDGDEVHYFKDYANGRYDIHAANIKEGLKGRSNRNLNNGHTIKGSLATSPDGTYGVNYLSRIIRKQPMSVSAPLFGLSTSKGLAADISANNLIAIVNQRRIYLTLLPAGIKNLNERKNIKSIVLPDSLYPQSNVKVKVSSNNQFVAVSYLKQNLDREYGEFNTVVKIYDVNGKLLMTENTRDVNALTFSNDSSKFYYNSGKKLTCLSLESKEGKIVWAEDDTYTFYTESGSIVAMTLSADDKMIGYASSTGYNKVVRARYGNDIVTCIMQDSERLKVIKK